jgi:hypothetical protein
MTTKDRGANARKTIAVLVNARERQELQKALDAENMKRGLSLGLGSKLRELGLLWARNQKRAS